ncbi:MAG: metal-sulfur cluster assembly factor, partial [Actinomycetota bacterium]
RWKGRLGSSATAQAEPEWLVQRRRKGASLAQELPLLAGASLYDWGMATEEEVNEALEEVIDPELGLDFVSLGLVYDVEIENGEVYITFTLTTPACPIGPQVTEQMREFVGELDGVEKVHPKMIFDPPWSPEMMSEDAKFALGF